MALSFEELSRNGQQQVLLASMVDRGVILQFY